MTTELEGTVERSSGMIEKLEGDMKVLADSMEHFRLQEDCGKNTNDKMRMKAGVSETDTPVISCLQIFCECEYLLGTNREKTFYISHAASYADLMA